MGRSKTLNNRDNINRKKTKGLGIWIVIFIFLLIIQFFTSYRSAKRTDKNPDIIEEHLIETGDVFDTGGYIIIDNVTIIYDGEKFQVSNSGDSIVRITAEIVGVKRDGTYESIEIPSFVGVDKAQYAKDMEENGWAIEKDTNIVRPGETLYATLSVFDFSTVSEEYPKADIDEDGYWDIVFTVHSQRSEDTIVVSTDDVSSGPYKFPAN